MCAAPVATNVTIIGEPTPGGTVRGSYFYEYSQAESGSTYHWYINSKKYLTTNDSLDFSITAAMAGAKIRFAVVPMSASGESGVETCSLEIDVFNGYQNITEEENRNSFMSQIGQYSFYAPDPKDRVFVASAAAFSLTDGTTQSVHVKGLKAFGGEPPEAIKAYLKNNPAIRMFSTERDFAALVPVLGSAKRLLLWGDNMNNIPPELDLNNIKSAYSNRTAIAFIYDNPPENSNTIGAIGDAANGGLVPETVQRALLFDPPKAIYATENAFAVLTYEGYVHTWGSATGGGSIGDIETTLKNTNVEKIVASASAFCAIGHQRNWDPEIKHPVVWGDPEGGGVLSPTQLGEILDQEGVVQVVANRNAFCAITKKRGTAISWGGADYGGTMSEAALNLAVRGNILLCRGSAWAFCMVNSAGDSESWGQAGYGGGTLEDGTAEENDAGKVFDQSGQKQRIQTLFNEMKVESWYERNRALPLHSCICEPDSMLGSNPYEITLPDGGTINFYANDASFFMVAKEQGGSTKELFSWGQPTGGGTIPGPVWQVLRGSVITAVYCTNGAYGVISNQGPVTGAVNVFGASIANQDAGEIPKELADYLQHDVRGLYSMKFMPPAYPTSTRLASAFAARRADGSYAIWGGGADVIDELFVPSS